MASALVDILNLLTIEHYKLLKPMPDNRMSLELVVSGHHTNGNAVYLLWKT
jgi:hypothetical protein